MRTRPATAAAIIALIVALVALGGAVVWLIGALSARVHDMATVALAAALRRDVVVGRMTGDPWRGISFEDVSLPPHRPGEPPVFEARRLTIHLDLRGVVEDLIARRGVAASVAGRLTQIIIDEPTLRLSHEAAGWNLGTLLPVGEGQAVPTSFAARVIVLNGTVTLSDRTRIAPRVFQARLVDVHGTADFSRAPRVALRASFVEERDGRRIPGRLAGAYLLDRRILDLDLQASGLDAAPWGQYLLVTPAFRVTAGQADADLHLLRSPSGTGVATDFSGLVRVRDGAAVLPGRPAAISAVEGEIVISNQAISTPGLRGTLNGSRFEVRGETSFHGEPRLDLVARSGAANLTALGRLFFPSLVPRLTGVARGEVRITGRASAPRLWGRIEAARGTFDRQPFDQASAEVALYGDMFSLTDARGRVNGTAVRGAALWALGRPAYFLTLDVDGADAALVRRWAPAALPPFDGQVHGSLAVAARGAQVSAVGRASMGAGRIQGFAVDGFDTTFRSDPTGLAIDHARARHGDTWVTASGRGDQDGRLSLDVLAHADDLATVPLPQVRAVPGGLAGAADFTGRIEGTTSSPVVRGFVQVTEGRAAGVRLNSASGRITAKPGLVEIDRGQARSGGARFRASGAAGWGPGAGLALEVEAERTPAALLGRLAGIEVPLEGTVDGRMRLDGPVARPRAAGSMTLREAAVLGQHFDEARAAFSWDGRRLAISGGSVQRGQSTLRLSGTFDRLTGLALDVSAQELNLRDVPLANGPARLTGHVDLTGRIEGLLASPRMTVEAASADLAINGLRFDRAAGVVGWADRTLSLEPVTLRTGGERYELRGTISLGTVPSLALTSTVADGRLTTLLGLGGVRLDQPLEATISGTAGLEGPLSNPDARLDLKLSSGRFGTHPLSGHVDLTLANQSLTIQGLEILIGPGRLAATGRYDLGGVSQIEISASELDLDVIRPLLRLQQPLLGRLDFTVQLGGTLETPELGLDLEITRGGTATARFDSLVAAAYYREGRLQVVQGLLVQNGHKLRASGSVPFNPKSLRFDSAAPLDFRISLADVNLSLLQFVTGRVEEASGAVEGTLTVAGTVAAPRLSGAVRVEGGSVRLHGVTTPIEALTVGLQFTENAIRIDEATARLGGGEMRLTGAVRFALSPSTGLALEVEQAAPLALRLVGARLTAPPVVDARFDGEVRAWGSLGDPRRPPTMNGRVAVSDGTLTVAASAPGAAGGRPFPLVFQGLQMDVGRDLAVRVGDLRFVLRPEGSLTLSGTYGDPRLEGTVEAQRGAVTAVGNTFDLQEGAATFRPALGVRPQVSARAVTRVGPTVITLVVRGVAPDALTLDFESDPPLARADIVTLLGRQAGISQLLTGDVTGLLRAEISRRLFAPVTLAIGRALGLSELSIEYDFEEPLRLTAGKAILPNLYITASMTFEESARWLWALEYRFAPDWRFAFRLDPDGRRTAIIWYTARF